MSHSTRGSNTQTTIQPVSPYEPVNPSLFYCYGIDKSAAQISLRVRRGFKVMIHTSTFENRRTEQTSH